MTSHLHRSSARLGAALPRSCISNPEHAAPKADRPPGARCPGGE